MNSPRPESATSPIAPAVRAGSAFRPGWALTAQAAAALVTVLALAVWQFSRGMEKTALANARAERLRAEPVAASAYTPETPNFTRLSLGGRYDERTFIVGGALGRGAQVLSPLRTPEGVFLVNRGWLPPSNAPVADERDDEGALDRLSKEAVDVVGVAWPRVAPPPHVAKQTWPEGWPKRVVGMDVERMASEVGAHAREIRLEHGQSGVLRAASLAWDYSASTHWGYVAQWTLIGVAVGVGYIVIGRRRGRQLPNAAASSPREGPSC